MFPCRRELSNLTIAKRQTHKRIREAINMIVPITESVSPESTNRWVPDKRYDKISIVVEVYVVVIFNDIW